MRFPRKLLALALVCAVMPFAANAESQFTTGGGTLTASAHLDFQITVPKILFLQVGTGTSMASLATVDQIAFVVPAANVGDSSVISATVGSGDLGTGQVTARLIGNNGNITFTSTTLGALNNGVAGDTISYGQIATAVATNTSPTALPHPALVDAATTTLTVSPVSGKSVNRDAKWTYTYLNANIAAPGVYGGTNANNSRVTYGASMP